MTKKYQAALAEDSSDAEKGSDGAEEDSGEESDSSHASQHTDASEQVLGAAACMMGSRVGLLEARSYLAEILVLIQKKSSNNKSGADAILSDAPHGKLVLTQSFR